METEVKFSIVIPVLNESESINSIINDLKSQRTGHEFEVIVVDAADDGSTIRSIEESDVITVTCKKGRGNQMNSGSEIARGEILLFLHADTMLPDDALDKIADVLCGDEYVGGAFGLGIDSESLLLKFIAAWARMRSRMNRIPYGDQAIFIRKEYFEKIGRFKEIPLMEDVDLMRRIKRDGKNICIFKDKVKTSARRWEKEGVLYTAMRNQILLSLYYLGVSPHKLAKFYRSHSK
jgi:rSAM/selenodomain-associated transferase 2